MKEKRAVVSKVALVARINRKLVKQDRKLRASRSARAQQDLGGFFVVDARRNFVVDRDVDLEKLGRKLGVLAAWEVAADV